MKAEEEVMICRPIDLRRDGHAAFPANPDGQWYALQTKARQEEILAVELAAKGITCYLPMTSARRVYAGVEAHVQAPLFPGQLFIKGTIEDVRTAEGTNRVVGHHLVDDGEQLEAELRNVHRALTTLNELEPCELPDDAFEVEVRTGPLQGVRGLVDSEDSQRIVLPVNSVDCAVSADVTGWLLERAV